MRAQWEHLTTWEASKITFHADRNCMLDNRILLGKLNRKGEIVPDPAMPIAMAIPMQMSSHTAKFGCRFCNSLGFGLRQVGLLHARQAHGWSWTLQLQHELWLQLDVLCLIRMHQSQPMLTSFCAAHGLLTSWISVLVCKES